MTDDGRPVKRLIGSSFLQRGAPRGGVFNGRLNVALEVEATSTAEVVGRADALLDEVPVACVELRAGESFSEAELVDDCRGKITSSEFPRAIFFLATDEWPMSATKVDKRGLRARLTKS